MWKIVFYIAAVIYCVYIAVMYNEPLLITILFLLLVFPALLLIVNLYLRHKVSVSIHIPVPVTEKEQKNTFYLHVDNPSFLPVRNLAVILEIKSALLPKKYKMKFLVNASGHMATEFPIDLEGISCQTLLLRIKYLRFYDYMGIFFLCKRCKEKPKELSILPALYELQVNMSEYSREFLLDSDIYDPEKSGDDSSEIFQIREYREGDRPQAVHWKRSAMEEQIMVKEYSRPLGYSVVFLLNQPHVYNGFTYEPFFELIYSLSYAMLEADCKHYISWYDSTTQDIERVGIEDFDSLYSFISALLKNPPAHTQDSLPLLYQEKYRGETFCTMLELDSELLLKKNEVEICKTKKEILNNCILI